MSLFSNVTGFLRNIIDSTSDPNAVYEVKADTHNHWPVCYRDECLCLYGPEAVPDGTQVYDVVVQRPLADTVDKQYVLARTRSFEEGRTFVQRLSTLLPLLVRRWPREALQLGTLQRICDAIRLHPGWTAAHVCACLQWIEPLSLPELAPLVPQPCSQTGVTPLHVAVEAGHLRYVTRMMLLEPPPPVDLADVDGNTVLHVAARGSKDMLALLAARAEPQVVNARNKQNLTALHVACMEDQPENVKTLLKVGADVNVAGQ